MGRTVDVTDSDGANQFITVDLHAEDRTESIRLFLRRSDAYFLGWRQGTEDGGGTVNLGSFFTLEAGVNLPGAIRSGTGTNVNTRFEGLASYINLSSRAPPAQACRSLPPASATPC